MKITTNWLTDVKSVTTNHMQSGSNEVISVQRNINYISEKILEAQDFIDQYQFENEEDEIHFFKCIKSGIDGLLIYYQNIQRIEQRCPIATIGKKKQHYESALKDLKTFYLLNTDFQRYHILQATHYDTVYYTRSTNCKYILDDDCPIPLDSRYNTKMSYKTACFYAFNTLQLTLLQRIGAVEKSPLPNAFSDTRIKEKLSWTASKTALAELIYALQEFGTFNNTKVQISKIADYLAYVFDVDLINIYKLYEDMRIRKKNRTPFLDSLRNSLLRRMELDDEKSQ